MSLVSIRIPTDTNMTQGEFQAFYVEWLQSNRILRLGQAFIGKVKGIQDPELFYMNDYNKAYGLIVERYIK